MPRCGTAGSYNSSNFIFLRSCCPVFHSGDTILHSSAMYDGSYFSVFLQTLGIFWRFLFLLYSSYEGACHCCFHFHFPNYEWCWAPFHVLIGHLYECLFKSFFEEMSVEILHPFLIGLSFCNWVIRILDIVWILDSYQIWLANIFSHSVGCLFTWLFLLPLFWYSIQESIAGAKKLFLCVFFWSFMVLGLKFIFNPFWVDFSTWC